MRARMAIYQANIRCELREVVLKEKPESMLSLSNKGTVPVLYTQDKKIIDQSLDVMYWALEQNDPDDWLDRSSKESRSLIDKNDNEFKYYLDRYKYHVGYPEHSQEYYRDKALVFFEQLERSLKSSKDLALLGKKLSLTDIAIFPFVRQFAYVDLDWFKASPYEFLKDWYIQIEKSSLFQGCMTKYEQWLPENTPVYFPS